MNNCKSCNVETIRPLYCSIQCVKRGWYVKNLTNKSRSFFTNKEEFFKTETGIGLKWELFIAEKLNAKHLLFNNSGADLEKDGILYDVKAANIYHRKKTNGKKIDNHTAKNGVWVFNRNKPKEVGYFICVCLINDKPEKILMIPGDKFPKKGAVVGVTSKYDIYKLQ